MEAKDIPAGLLLGEDILLCPPTLRRLEDMHGQICGFNTAHRYLGEWSQDTSLEACARSILSLIEGFARDREYVFHVIERGQGALVGSVGIHRTNPVLNCFHVGYWVGSGFMGRGYGTQAVILARDLALQMLDPVRLEISAAQSNTASNRVAEKAGFEVEAVLKDYIHDHKGSPDASVVRIYPLSKGARLPQDNGKSHLVSV